MNTKITSLRPDYDFSLNSPNNESNTRSLVYQAIPSGSLVLDVGCDTGRFGEILISEKNCIVHGIEPWLPAAQSAQTRLHEVFVRVIENEQSFNGLVDYDVVLFLCVLEHLQDPWAALKGAITALKPSGIICVIVPNIAHISVVRRLLQGQFEYTEHGMMDRTHLRWFTQKSLRKALEEVGFIDVNILGILGTPHLPRFFINLLGKIFPDLFSVSIFACGRKS